MLTATKRKVRRKIQRGPTRFPNICEDAEKLGVDRVTLYRALSGQRPDLKGLIARYHKLKGRGK
jgi:DNA-binding phage protein